MCGRVRPFLMATIFGRILFLCWRNLALELKPLMMLDHSQPEELFCLADKQSLDIANFTTEKVSQKQKNT